MDLTNDLLVKKDETLPERVHANAAMDRYADGDDTAFSTLYDVLAPRLYAFVYRQTRDKAGSEDIVQQTFMQMHCARSSFARGAEVFPWAYSIARRLLIDAYRRGRYADAFMETMTHENHNVSTDALPDAVLQSKQMADRLERALMKLPESLRISFQLVRLEGLSLIEAAAVLGTTPNAVKLRALRTSETLKLVLADKGSNR